MCNFVWKNTLSRRNNSIISEFFFQTYFLISQKHECWISTTLQSILKILYQNPICFLSVHMCYSITLKARTCEFVSEYIKIEKKEWKIRLSDYLFSFLWLFVGIKLELIYLNHAVLNTSFGYHLQRLRKAEYQMALSHTLIDVVYNFCNIM